jgi:hypothetical protein
MKLMNFMCLGGASMAAQWYWPPAVGALFSSSVAALAWGSTEGQAAAYIEANSARTMKLAKVPIQPKM